MPIDKTVVGFTGFIGSGCTFISEYHFPHKYHRISLSEILKELYRKKYGRNQNPTRTELQNFGNRLRKQKNKGKDYLAKLAWRRIKDTRKKYFVIDSIKNPAELDNVTL